jgi:hypothetical protein
MTKRKHRSQAEWQAIIQQQKDSGLNAAEFCRQQGLLSKTFYKRRLAQSVVANVQTSHPSFIKIRKPSTQIASSTSGPVGILHYHNSQLHIQSNTDAHWLAQLMQALS